MAVAYAKLDKDEIIFNKIKQAMTSHAFFVAGTDRLDTIIMEENKGKILAKHGAESVYCITVSDQGIGTAVKIEDGCYRALDAFVQELLYKHGYMTQDELKIIKNRLKLDILSHRKEIVGSYKRMLEN